jgi:GH35 family endo-1,4-beta-xylanase
MMHVRRHILAMVLAAASLAATASPCAARGTGGWLRDWVISTPFEGTSLDSPVLAEDFAAYPGFFGAGCIWLPVEAEAEGRLNLRALYPKPPSGVVLLATFFEAPAAGKYTLRVGSDDAVRVEVDGRVVHSNVVRRGWTPDQDRVKVQLAKGWHRMLVRVVNYSGDWAASVRVADEKDQPLDVRSQPTVPEALARLCRLDEPLTVGERAETAAHLSGQMDQLDAELQGALARLSQAPEGYVTFAEYEGARAQGLRFFEAMSTFWREVGRDTWDLETVQESRKGAVEAARGFSEVLAEETEKMVSAMAREHRVWEILGGDAPRRRDAAAAVVRVAGLLAQTRRLAARVENERILAARFENDIRNFRQRDLTLRVVDAEGRPVEGAEVEITQTGHDFLFGCNLFAFRRWDDDKKNALYERRFRDLFNLAVVPMYWSVLERYRGRPEFEPVDAAVGWCREHRIQVCGHPLVWSETVPRWADELDVPQVRSAVQAHVRQVVGRYRETVNLWDVVERPVPVPRVATVSIDPEDALRWAMEASPRGRLLVGGGDAAPLAEVARRLAASGVRLDGVGLAAPQYDGAWPVDLVRKALETAAAAGLPVHVTQVAILGSTEDEAEQAEAVRHFYTAALAHPKVASITWWDLSDRFALRNAPAGLVRADLSVKPAYRVLDRLINHLWRTDAAGHTGADGRIGVRAFFGTYKITVRQGARKATAEVHLSREGASAFEVVLMPAASK